MHNVLRSFATSSNGYCTHENETEDRFVHCFVRLAFWVWVLKPRDHIRLLHYTKMFIFRCGLTNVSWSRAILSEEGSAIRSCVFVFAIIKVKHHACCLHQRDK